MAVIDNSTNVPFFGRFRLGTYFYDLVFVGHLLNLFWSSNKFNALNFACDDKYAFTSRLPRLVIVHNKNLADKYISLLAVR